MKIRIIYNYDMEEVIEECDTEEELFDVLQDYLGVFEAFDHCLDNKSTHMIVEGMAIKPSVAYREVYPDQYDKSFNAWLDGTAFGIWLILKEDGVCVLGDAMRFEVVE